MREITTIFVDDGGVLNDNGLRALQWRRLVGEFLAPRLGGEPAEWGEANRGIFPKLWSGEIGGAAPGNFASFKEWHFAYASAWLGHMCELVRVPTPPPALAHRILVDADDYIDRRVVASIPGAAEAVRALWAAGFCLNMGSGGDSRQLANRLEVLGIRPFFQTLYGADLVDMTKSRPEFHARILKDASVDPARSLFIDDSSDALDWAASCGARTALIGQEAQPRFTFNAPSLEALATLLVALR